MNINETVLITTKDKIKLFARRLVLADREALQQFGQSLSDESTALFLPHPYDDAIVDVLLKRSENGLDLTMGLFDKKKIVAYFFLWYYDNKVPLLGIGLHDTFQGKGIGQKILKLLIDEARRNGCDGIELTTLPNNQRAFSLYEKLGFQYYADVENKVGDGRIVVEKAMFYPLKPGVSPSMKMHQPPICLSSQTGH